MYMIQWCYAMGSMMVKFMALMGHRIGDLGVEGFT